MRTVHVPAVPAAYDSSETARQNARARQSARTMLGRARETLLCVLDCQRLDALACDDMDAVARCEDRIVDHERALGVAGMALRGTGRSTMTRRPLRGGFCQSGTAASQAHQPIPATVAP